VASRNQTTWRLVRAPPDRHYCLAPFVALPVSEPGCEIVNPIVPPQPQVLQEHVLRDQHLMFAGAVDVNELAG